MTRLRHYDHLNTVRFVTFSCYERYKLFRADSVITDFVEVLDAVREARGFKLLGYVVMPNHVHVVLWPPEGMKLGRVIGEIKSRSARRILERVRQENLFRIDRLHVRSGGETKIVFWQPRCYDHNCRTPDTVWEKIEYCHKNPVTQGLVQQPGEWRWSSFNWYAGCRDVPIHIDTFEL